MSVHDAMLLSVSDIMLAMSWKLYYKQQDEEMKQRQDWERTRLLAAYMISPYSKKKISKLSDLFKFEWEVGERPGDKLSEEQRRILLQKLDQTLAKNGE